MCNYSLKERKRKEKEEEKEKNGIPGISITWAIAIRSRISILTIYSDPPICILIAVICENNTLDILYGQGCSCFSEKYEYPSFLKSMVLKISLNFRR